MKPLLPVLIGCMLAFANGPVAGQQLGRLFFTPEQRDALDARRRARIPDRPAAVAASPTTRIDGQVTRSGRNSTVWVNGQPYAEGEDAGGVRVYPGRADPGSVAVKVGESKRRIGQAAYRSEGRRDPRSRKRRSARCDRRWRAPNPSRRGCRSLRQA